ncbi:glutamate receptor ionotropic, kainate glr-3-like [Palaemon carinicauda]|uniref:glutamate receptor ionotropic, kainate glr-3-like n=1 Tax=Palaemon carinicauda TaxID=392227 RepID=UPI0035B64D43
MLSASRLVWYSSSIFYGGQLTDGGHLSVTTVIYPPHTYPPGAYKNIPSTNQQMPISGPMVEVLEILSNAINFTAEVIDYTVPMMIEIGRILSRRGKTEVDPWGYFMPLSPEVWLCLLSSLFLVMASSFLISAFDTSNSRSKYALENYIRILLSQDSAVPHASQWSKGIIVVTWLVGTLIVMKAYAGNLSSLLIVRYVPQPHHSVKAVVDDPRVISVMSGGGSFQQTLHEAY